MMNFFPLPYRRVSVQRVEFRLIDREIRKFLCDKPVYRATDFIVFRNQDQTAIVKVAKKSGEGLFRKIESIDLIAGSDVCHWVEDSKIDTSNCSQMISKAQNLGLDSSSTLVVEGAFGHVNFIMNPAPIYLWILDSVPPFPSRLMDLIQKALIVIDKVPLIPVNKSIDTRELAPRDADRACLFPCRASDLRGPGDTYYLDEHPPKQEWTMIGCERSEEIYMAFYSERPVRIESCPRKLAPQPQCLSMVRCCLWETTYEIHGHQAIVPWGSDLQIVLKALTELLKTVHPELALTDNAE